VPHTSYVIATPSLTPAQSTDTDSLLSPRKFLRTWTSEDEDKDKDLYFEDKDKDLKIGPRGQGFSSRTTTLVSDVVELWIAEHARLQSVQITI